MVYMYIRSDGSRICPEHMPNTIEETRNVGVKFHKSTIESLWIYYVILSQIFTCNSMFRSKEAVVSTFRFRSEAMWMQTSPAAPNKYLHHQLELQFTQTLFFKNVKQASYFWEFTSSTTILVFFSIYQLGNEVFI